jgi:hypothetical protein
MSPLYSEVGFSEGSPFERAPRDSRERQQILGRKREHVEMWIGPTPALFGIKVDSIPVVQPLANL